MVERIPIGDFRAGERERELVLEVLDSNRLSEWKKVEEFEKRFAEYVERKHSIAFNSGTSAEITGFKALQYSNAFDFSEKPRVITNPITFAATVNAIKLSGFEPAFVDIDFDTLNISPGKLREFLEESEFANECGIIMPVFLMGFSANVLEMEKIAKKHNMVLFSDCAQSHGALFNGRKIGSFGELSAFSFYVSHNIQAGEMGAIATNNEKLVEIMKKIKSYGKNASKRNPSKEFLESIKAKGLDLEDVDARFTMEFIGYNFRTTELSAAIGLAQLEKAQATMKQRQENVKYLNEELEKFSDLLHLPNYSKENDYLGYAVIIKKPELISRKKFRDELEAKGIETRPLFGCVPFHQPAFLYLNKHYEKKLSNARFVGENGFYFGCHQYLSRNDLDRIISAVTEVLKEI